MNARVVGVLLAADCATGLPASESPPRQHNGRSPELNPDDDAARYGAALELNARLRPKRPGSPTRGGLRPVDGEGAADEARYGGDGAQRAPAGDGRPAPGHGPADGYSRRPPRTG